MNIESSDVTEHDLKCEEVLRQLVAYLDRELDARTAAGVERHLAGCRSCFSRAEFEKRLKVRVAETGSSAAPERLRQRVKAIIDRF